MPGSPPMPPAWGAYVTVDDVDAKAAKAKQSYPRYVFSESRTDLPT